MESPWSHPAVHISKTFERSETPTPDLLYGCLPLFRRAQRRSVGAKHTALSRLRLHERSTGGTLPEPHAGIGRHGVRCLRAAVRAADARLSYRPRHARNLFPLPWRRHLWYGSAKPAQVTSRRMQTSISQTSVRQVRRISNPAARTRLRMTLVGCTNVRNGLPDRLRR